MENSKRKYGWKRDVHDTRDYMYAVPEHVANTALPVSVDLETIYPPVVDQGTESSCVGNSGVAVFEAAMIKESLPTVPLARNFLYYNARPSPRVDEGCQIRDAAKSLGTQGICSETLWPYTADKVNTQPTQECYIAAKQELAIQYYRVNQDLVSMKSCMAEGFGIWGGFTVFPALESQAVAQTGILPDPVAGDQAVGGHAIVIVGYDDTKQMFKVRNSWGCWGQKGHFWVSYKYFTDPNLANDFWTVRLVSNPGTPEVPGMSWWIKLTDWLEAKLKGK